MKMNTLSWSLLGLMVATSAWALQVGDPVPVFPLPSTRGEDIRLSDYAGRWLVLYFYPRAFTPGCTAQSCSLRDTYGEISERGVAILGASLDTVDRQREFKTEHHLPFELLSDTDKELARAFDSLMIGGLMAARKTFIIDPDGRVAYRFDRPSTNNHGEEVLSKLDDLLGPQGNSY